MNPLRLTGGVLALVALVCLVLVQFLPWGTQSQSSGGARAEVTAYTWESEMTASFLGTSSSESHGWYSSEWDDADDDQKSAVTQIRIAIPILLAGLVLTAAGGLLFFLAGGGAGAIVTTIASLATVAATWLFAASLDDLFEGNQEWGASFYLAIVGSGLALLGGILGLVAGNQRA